jgi:VanZ family protein
MVFEVYAPHISSGSTARLPVQLRTWLPVLACAAVLAVESTSYLGSDHTSAPLQRIAEAIFGYDVGVHWKLIHSLIRKTGHVVGYGIFSLACFRGFWIALQRAASRLLRQIHAHGLAILATFIAASADEYHQSFLPNRSGQFSDVLLDTCGAVALCFVLFLVMQAAEWRRRVLDTRPAQVRENWGVQFAAAVKVLQVE